MIESNARIMKRNAKEYMNDDNTPQRTIECPAATAILLLPLLLLLLLLLPLLLPLPGFGSCSLAPPVLC